MAKRKRIPLRPDDGGDLLLDAVQTFEERQLVYSDNYKRLANAMVAMYPNGLNISTQEDWCRIYFFLAMVTKLSRYATNWHKGHKDSLMDTAVYAAMLAAFDEWKNTGAS